MCECNLDFDPLQQQIRHAVSIKDDTARALDELSPHVSAFYRRLIGELVRRLHRADILARRMRDDMANLIDHLDQQIARGERREIIVDESYVELVYTQVVYTAEAMILRGHMPILRRMYGHLAAIDQIGKAETLALEVRSARQH